MNFHTQTERLIAVQSQCKSSQSTLVWTHRNFVFGFQIMKRNEYWLNINLLYEILLLLLSHYLPKFIWTGTVGDLFSIGHLRKNVIWSVPAMDAGLVSNHGSSAFRTSELNPSCSKSSFPGVCEVVVTTLYYVITQIAYLDV